MPHIWQTLNDTLFIDFSLKWYPALKLTSEDLQEMNFSLQISSLQIFAQGYKEN